MAGKGPRTIGIDLGTTNSCVAVWEEGGVRVLPSPEGNRTTPSVVALPAGKPALVGLPARRQLVTDPGRTFYGTKRLIGLKVSHPAVANLESGAPFRIAAAPNGDAWLRMDDRDVSPQEIASLVLERMRFIAEEALAEPITQAIVTVPAYFDDAQRQATKDAGRIAGLDVRRILNEPTAAALAYGAHRHSDKRRIAVFDLGGGTFDVSVMSIDRGVFQVLAVSGDTALGGDDFDRAIVDLLLEEAEQKYEIDLRSDPVSLSRLREEAERAKVALTSAYSVAIHVPYLGPPSPHGPRHLEKTLTRDAYHARVAPLLARLAEPCRDALKSAGLRAEDLDDVLLVGGMTRVPRIQEEVATLFGRRPSKGANPDEIVALGAALHGGLLSGDLDDAVLLDVTPRALGVRLSGGSFSVVIPRNTTVPTRMRRVFATTQANQERVDLEIYQGESRDVRENRLLGRFGLHGLSSGPAGSVRVEITFSVDPDGIVHVRASELGTQREAQVTLSPSGGLSEEEIERIAGRRRADPLDS